MVCDLVFALAGPSMRKVIDKMMKKPVPSTTQEPLRGLIPPKGIKRKNNVEGSELLDGDEISEDEDDDDDESDSEANENVLLEQLVE